MQTIFVFAYYSFKDPVFQSAVLPYLKLVKDNKLRFVLLTWEQKEFRLSSEEKIQIKKELQIDNIYWFSQTWHSGSLKILKKSYDFFVGICLSLFLIFKFKANKIYSEGFPGAIIGHFLSKISVIPHIIHTFEPHADYMVDAKVWTRKSWEFKILKILEPPIARHAQQIITATESYKNILSKIAPNTKIWVISSLIDFNFYKFDEVGRNKIRTELQIKSSDNLIVYMGKMGGMYMEEEIFEFFAHCEKMEGISFQYLLLTNKEVKYIKKMMFIYHLPHSKVHVKFAKKEEVPFYLSACDLAFCGIRPIPSRKYSSPIKNGEYWANGLPTLIPKGIAEDYLLAEEYGLGMSFQNNQDITKNRIQSLILQSRTFIKQKALPLRSLESYKGEFMSIFVP